MKRADKAIAPGRFTLATTLSEALRNLQSGRLVLIVRIVLALLVGFGTTFATLTQVSGIEARYNAGIEAGRFVWRASGTTGTLLPSGECEALASVEGITASGSVIKASEIIVVNQPLARYELVQATPGLPSIYWPSNPVNSTSGGVIVGSYAAQTLGLISGGTVQFRVEAHPATVVTLPVAQVMPPSLREPSADRRLYFIAPAGPPTTDCLVDPKPAHSADAGALLRSWFPASLGVVVRPLINEDPLARTPEAELAERLSAWGWVIGAGVLSVATLLIWHGRRADVALYRLLGMLNSRMAAMFAVDFLFAVLVPVQAGVLLAVFLSKVRGAFTPVAGYLALVESAALVVVLSVVPLFYTAWSAGRRSSLDSLKGF